MAATPDGKGYWLVAADGGIFTFGDARLLRVVGRPTTSPIRWWAWSPAPTAAATPSSTANGVVLALGDAQAYGGLTLNPDATPVSDIIGNGAGTGYWLLDPEAWTYSFTQRHAGGGRFPGFVRHRRRGGLPDRAGSRHRLLLQPVRTVRGVVRALRHLGLAPGRHPHPVLRLHRRHLRLGRRPRRAAPADGHAGSR